MKHDSNIKPNAQHGAAPDGKISEQATCKVLSAKSGTNFFDALDTFEIQFAWLSREFKKMRAQKQTAKTMRTLRELAARNAQLGADLIRFMEQ